MGNLYKYLIGGKKTGMSKRRVFTFNEVEEDDILYLWNYSKKTGKLVRKVTWEVSRVGKNSATITPRGKVFDYQVWNPSPDEKLERMYEMTPDIPSREFDNDHYIWNTRKFFNIITTFNDKEMVEELLMSQSSFREIKTGRQ